MRKLIIVLATLFILPVTTARAGEEEGGEQKIKEADVPKAVMDAVKKKYPKAKFLLFEKEVDAGKTVFEIGLKNEGTKMDVNVSLEGKILAEESLIKKDALPAEVKKGLADSKYATWAIKRAERIITEEKEDAATFEVLVAEKGKMMEVVLDKTGKITKEEVKSAKDND